MTGGVGDAGALLAPQTPRHAALNWHGTADAWRLGILAAIAVLASATRQVAEWRRRSDGDRLT